MEVRETGACGIAEKEYAIDLSGLEIEQFQKVIQVAVEQEGEFDKEYGGKLAEDLEEKKMESETSIELVEDKMHQVYKMVLVAKDAGDDDVDDDFVEELVSYIQHVVGIE